MKEKIFKNKTLVIVVAALLVAGIGFGGGMAVRSSLADEGNATITLEKAKSIALENAGVSAGNATFTKAELDKDDSPDVYDIEFHTAQNEYEFEIDAITGDILEKNYEPVEKSGGPVTDVTDNGQGLSGSGNNANGQDLSNAGKNANDGYIGIAKAKKIALQHAGCHANSATFTETKLDSDDGVKVYEIQFISGDHEYDYEIHASTGKILEHDSENRHHDD